MLHCITMIKLWVKSLLRGHKSRSKTYYSVAFIWKMWLDCKNSFYHFLVVIKIHKFRCLSGRMRHDGKSCSELQTRLFWFQTAAIYFETQTSLEWFILLNLCAFYEDKKIEPELNHNIGNNIDSQILLFIGSRRSYCQATPFIGQGP